MFSTIPVISTIPFILTRQWFGIQAWAYGKRWPWTPQSFTRARHAVPFYALWVGHPLCAFQDQGWQLCSYANKKIHANYPCTPPAVVASLPLLQSLRSPCCSLFAPPAAVASLPLLQSLRSPCCSRFAPPAVVASLPLL
jgi:hypothetical protein